MTNMKQFARINRRYYLKGIGGAALALPFLEILQGKEVQAQAATESRLIVCYAGQAMGGDSDKTPHGFRPPMEGKLSEMTLPLSLEPLGGRALWTGAYTHSRFGAKVEPIRDWPGEVYDVRKHVSVITGMKIPLGSGVASATTFHHSGTISPQLAGVSSNGKSPACYGPTADGIAEAQLGGEAIRCLVQAGHYGNGMQYANCISWREVNGKLTPLVGQASPQAMFRALFENFVPDPVMVDDALQARLVARRRSVVDLMGEAATSLHSRLGIEDRERLQVHLDGISTLKTRVDALSVGNTEGCHLPQDPGPDSPYVGGVGGNKGDGGHDPGEGWSNEEKRAEAFIDLLVTAMACGMSRVGTIQFTYHQSFINGENPTGLIGDQHQIGHGGGVDRANGSPNNSVSLCHHFPVRYFGTLVGRLASTRIHPDRTLLEDTAAGLFFEAGHGEEGAHSGDEMASLIAGGAGGLLQGSHVRLEGEPPARVLASMLKAVGCEGKLGEVSSHERLFGA